jgi:Putative Ig domain
MKSSVRIVGAVLLMTLASFLVGCSSSTAPIAVTLKATPTAIDQGQTSAITATVANDSKKAGVTWGSVSSGSLSGTTTTAATYNTAASVTSQATVTVTAISITDTSKSGSVQITVNPLPAINTTTPPGPATSGQTYSYTLAATGGTAPFTWSVTPALPAGLSLAPSTGVISGIPTQSSASNSSYTFKVTDATGASETQAFSIAVSAPPALAVTTASLPGATVGTAYTAPNLTQSGGVGPYTWALVSGPSWLSVSSSGALSGTPTTNSGSPVAVTVSVTDSETPNNVTANSSGLTIAISLAPLQITTTSLPAGAVSGAYAGTVSATGGLPPYKNWSLSGQPAWLSINSSTGALSGSPTAAGTTPSFTVSVQDSESSPQTAQQSFTITVNAALAITTSSLGAATVGQDYSDTVQASGGVTPFTWSLSGEPSWLSINSSTGALSGTPTAAGTTPSFTVQVQDSEGTTKQASFTITVNPGSACTGTLNNSLLNGHYAFMMKGWSGSTTATSAAGAFVADGNGGLSGGLIDVADQSKNPGTQSLQFTGTYCVGSDNLAILTVNPTGGNTATVAAALDNNDHNGHIIGYDTSGQLISGLLRQQTTSAFSAGVSGNYAFGLVGADQGGSRFALAGHFNSNSGSLTGEADYDDAGGGSNASGNTTLDSTTNLTVNSTTGRGTATILFAEPGATLNFVFYVVNANELIMMALDSAETPPTTMTGRVFTQSSSLTLSGTAVLSTADIDNSGQNPVAEVQGGILSITAPGGVSGTFSLLLDDNDGGTLNSGTVTGNYNITADGRMPVTNLVCPSGCNHAPVFYVYGTNLAFQVGTGGGGQFGNLIAQTKTTFAASDLAATYLGGTDGSVIDNGSVSVSTVTFSSGNETVSGSSDKNSLNGGVTSPGTETFNADYCPASSGTTCASSSNGRFLITCPTGSTSCTPGTLQNLIYMISDSDWVIMEADTGNTNPKIEDYHQ